jgi:hypothetical protein
MYGLDNTPLFDYDTNVINPNAKNAYIKVTQNIGNSKLLTSIQDYLKVIQKSGYKLTDEVKKFRDNANKNL